MASGLPDYRRGIDIAAQSLDKLAVDVAAQTVSELDIDIVAQTIARLDIDVTAQALAELTNRPKYGAPMLASGGKATAALGYTTLVTISGKGMVYGGAVYLNHTSTQKNSMVIPVVDGNHMLSLSFYNLMLLGVTIFGVYPSTLRRYDEASFIYCVGLNYGMTFETSFSLVYNELHGSTPTVFYEVMYAVV